MGRPSASEATLGLRAVEAVAMAAGVAVVVGQFLVPTNVYPGTLSPLVVALSALSRRRATTWTLAVGLAVASLAAPVLGQPPIAPHPGLWLVWLNRLFTAGSALVTAAIGTRWIAAQEALAADRAALAERNQRLDEINTELAAREVEIASQNEELQLQSEELERQGEELRVANDDLAARERVLAQLLELSRSLAGELTTPDVMARVCDALTLVLTPRGAAAAILLHEDDTARVVCHLGFGDDPPDATSLPYGKSFASLVIARGQTGYVHDLTLRPDLRVPQPRTGPPLVSVLGAPLWVRGQPVGVLEAYAHEPTQWTDENIGLVTSLAAQAGLSLQSARLFEEVEDGRRRLEAIFRTLPIPVLVAHDPECRLVTGNPAAAALFGAAADANFSPLLATPARVRRELHENGERLPPEAYPLVRAVLRGEDVVGAAYELVIPPARRMAVLLSAAPILDAHGDVAGGVCAFVDVSAQKALERELDVRRREAEEASARKTRFLAAVSHDIRTPANAIGLQAELVRRSVDNPALAPTLPRLAADLQRSAALLVDLVTEILDFTRLDSGRVELQEDDFPLAALVAEECRQLAPVATAKGLALEAPPLDPPLWLHADRVKLGRVVGNLVDNAIKFTERGAVRVTVTVGADRRPLVVVADTGPGLPPEHRERVFDEFFQLRNPERDRTKGRGLGLAICKRLVEAMGGVITVDSAPGAGTRFAIALPASSVIPAPVHTMPPLPPPSGGLGGLRVLLAEDDADTRRAVSQILTTEGAEVVEAAEGASALRLARATFPHVLLLDLMMPGIDGTEVLRALHAERPPGLARIVVVTADHASRNAEELGRLGADAVVPKPVDPARLLAMLRQLVPAAAQGDGRPGSHDQPGHHNRGQHDG